jgi:hypothetical protein
MSTMTKVGDHVQCPKCRGAAHVVWVAQDEKTVAIKCVKPHNQINSPREFRMNTPTKTKKGMVFLVEMKKEQA